MSPLAHLFRRSARQPNVVHEGHRLKVSRVHARRVFAFVVNHPSLRDWPYQQFIRVAMRQNILSVPITESPMAELVVLVPAALPALVFAGLGDLAPEAFFKRQRH